MLQIRYTRNLFLRGICISYLFAFLSFYIQIPGLYGNNGILPARIQVDLTDNAPLLHKLMQKPTLLWFAPYVGLNVEYALDVIALCGVVLSFLGFIYQKFCISSVFVGLWVLYYSLYQIGQIFMWFQWDLLLLEVGFLCIIIAPLWYFNQGKNSTPSDSVTFWTVRWLLFRLLFSSGIVKFLSGCPIWWSLKALNIHFESQCIPTSLAWYTHHLPTWFLKLSTVAAVVIEIFIPFLFFFANRKIKIIGFYLQIFLQVCIIATGNYNFFNLLTICLCISVLDDQFFYKKSEKNTSQFMNYFSTIVCILVYAAVIFLTIIVFQLRVTDNWTIESEIAITKERLISELSRILATTIYVAMCSLGMTVSDAVTVSMFRSKSFWKNILTTLTTLFYAVIVCSIFALSVVPYSTLQNYSTNRNITIPDKLKEIYNKIERFHIVNSYGLFRRMTGVDGRPEIIIEGSDNIDGPWKEYGFLYKPGNVNNSLPFVAPYQPRLDWQMWFAALSTYHQNPWLMSFTYRLLNGQPEVLSLLNNVENPFRENPPKFIKASLYTYRYTPWVKGMSGPSWWIRERVGEYFPIFSRDHTPLIEYLMKMKIISNKPDQKITNEYFKLVLDFFRNLTKKVEASILLWGVFTAGCTIIVTGYNGVSKKK